MVNIEQKTATRRRAVASGRLTAKPETIAKIRNREIPKGDALALAEVAGILGAKRTAEILPLCHPLPIDSVRVSLSASHDFVEATCEVITTAKTGVEMEALAGVSSALLCVYDLAKAVDPVLKISEIKLDLKEGGKSGVWTPDRAKDISLSGVQSAVITMSDRCFRGEMKDESGPEMIHWLESKGASTVAVKCVPDELSAIISIIELAAGQGAKLIMTTGGTGLGPRDVTPEAVEKLGGKIIPGIGESLRKSGAAQTPMAWISRSAGYLYKGALVICLPGSKKAVREGLESLEPILGHALKITEGAGHL